ncbi:MAG TPA: molybdopterin-guanine dinucleotide biosynthesis protein A [Alphaproteobacteria bacterium]|nr:molybdopterin-guanine dinucleotide biosynthesis protein A [Alphaproteobacteria bacterium]
MGGWWRMAVLAGAVLAAGGAWAQEPAEAEAGVPAGEEPFPYAEEAESRHPGYYYPEAASVEAYTGNLDPVPGSDRAVRSAFLSGFAQRALDRPYAPQFAIFGKGADLEKLIVVSLQDDSLNTLYRMRGMMAMLTAVARASTAFRETEVAEHLNFLDLLASLGFRQVTLSDGRSWSHHIRLEAPAVEPAQ